MRSGEITRPYFLPPLSSAQVNGATMTWREVGSGDAPPLFLMHGVGTNARLWAGQFAAFGGERRVIGWNAPGYAGSDPVPHLSPIPGDYGRAALALLDHLEIPSCIAIGQSLGSIMATALALRAPERIAAVALTSPAAGLAVPQGDPLPEIIASRLRDAATLTPEALATGRAPRLLSPAAGPEARAIVHRAMSEIDPDGYSQALRMMAGADLPTIARELRGPVLVMWGAADIVTPPEECRRVADAVPGALRHELPAVGHAMAAEAPVAFNAVLRPFIERADATALSLRSGSR
jgi:pimeloyl-ACP methyl ester carboxylesterase